MSLVSRRKVTKRKREQFIVALSHLFFSTLTKTASLKLQYQRNSSILSLVDKSNGTVEKLLVYFTLYLQAVRAIHAGLALLKKSDFEFSLHFFIILE